MIFDIFDFSLGRKSRDSYSLRANVNWSQLLKADHYHVYIFHTKDYTLHTSFIFLSGKDSYQLMLTTRGVCMRKVYKDKCWIRSGAKRFIGIIDKANIIRLLSDESLKQIRMRIYTTCTVFVKHLLPTVTYLCNASERQVLERGRGGDGQAD